MTNMLEYDFEVNKLKLMSSYDIHFWICIFGRCMKSLLPSGYK